MDEAVATLRAGPLRERAALLETHNGALAEDLARIRQGVYADAPVITLLFMDHRWAFDAWLRAVATNLTVDAEQPGDAWDAFELRLEAQRHLRLLAEYPQGRELLQHYPQIVVILRDNLTRDYTYRGADLVGQFRAQTQATLDLLDVPATAGMEEEPIAAALRRGPVVFDVQAAGAAAMTQGRRQTSVEIPTAFLETGFFAPGAHVTAVAIPRSRPTLNGALLVDQVGLSRRPAGTVDYRDWRDVTKPKTFVNRLKTLPNDRKTIVLYRPKMIPLSRARQWFPEKIMIQLDASVGVLTSELPLLVRAAEANGKVLDVDDLRRTLHADQEVLLIAA